MLTAWDILSQEKSRKRIVTSCKELDDILGGGIGLKELTEIFGEPGVGKTQLGMQLAINVQIPKEFDGIGGHAVYIDTEGSFMVERISEMAESCAKEIMMRATQDPQVNMEQVKAKIKVETFLSQIHFFRVHSATEQEEVINKMESFLAEQSEVRLIVIDSMAFQLRQDFDDTPERTCLLSAMGQSLMILAEKNELAIVAVNQVTESMTPEGLKVLPALGDGWSHITTNQLILYWMDGKRHAYLSKSPFLPTGASTYSVSAKGIESVVQSSNLPSRTKESEEPIMPI